MHYIGKRGPFVLCGLLAAMSAGAQAQRGAAPAVQFTETELKELTLVQPVDVHTHILNSDPAFTAMLEHFNLHVLDIFVGHVAGNGPSAYSPETYVSRKQDSWNGVLASGGRAKLSTSFPRTGWNEPNFAQAAISSIKEDVARGAIGVTIWTNSITQFKNESGKFALADDPKLEPIYKYMAAHHIPLISHTAMPDETWVPDPEAKPGSEPASMAASDHVIELNPNLRVVAAHLGSYKEEMDGLTARLARYPNVAVDTAGRMDYLMGLPTEEARAFILKYQNRILYGSDNAFNPGASVQDTLTRWQNRYVMDWRYLSGDGTVALRGKQVQCLNLPKPVLHKLYHENAVRWVSRIDKGS
jgi:predicted TIM-barrel fold metal-dependent hydrolase